MEQKGRRHPLSNETF